MSEDSIAKRFREKIQEARKKKLKILDLSNAPRTQALTKIPEEVFALKHIKILKLSGNKIDKIPDFIINLSNLTEVDLSFNQLNQLPESLGNLSNLTEVDLSFNQLDKLPECLGKLSNLTEVYLSFNQLNQLPESLGNLSNLTKLDLSFNQLIKRPESLGNLSNLTKLDLSSNQLTKLPEYIGNLCNLTKLDLSRNKLTNLPEYFGDISNLSQLYLSDNQLTKLPDNFGSLSTLILLNLSDNQLTELPESLGKLSNLRKLFLSKNKLTKLPDNFGSLANLILLTLSDNKLNKLPDSIGNISNLTELYLSDNKLNKLPESIGNISNLIELYLSDNKLNKIPYSIGNISNLIRLDLSNNQLNELPYSLGNLSNLIRLDLSDNPLVMPPPKVVSEGVASIKQYLRQLRKEGKAYIYEAKLLIVGEAGAGKTSLAKKIQDCEYQLQDNQTSTEGIDVIKWSFTLDNEREFKVNIWDFGGQEIYHATHQFFLSKRSLYTLVADSRKEDTDFYYWLNIVEKLSNDSPLLIIKNEKQERQRDINENALRGQFTNLKETLATNLKTNRGLAEIISAIQYYIQNLPHVGQELPKTWVNVRQSLENDSRNYIYLHEYLEICEDNGFTLLEDKLQLSGYLHDLGVCLNFQDQEDSLLSKIVILKPEWGTDAVYKVLDNQEVINNKGKFTRNDLKGIWQEDKYASTRGELLELMKKFQLCYEIPDCKDTFIAPQLLSDNQPDYDWDTTSHNLILRYDYHDFMPKGIITRLIVVMHQYIDQQQYVWKSGVILTKDNTKAEVIECYGKREIKIRVAGTDQRGLLTIVAYELDKINVSYQRLKYSKLIPCNCSTCKDSQSPYSYPYETLQKFIADQQDEIQCQTSYEMVNVWSLLGDIIDLNQLVSKYQHDSNKLLDVKGDIKQSVFILAQNGNIYGDYKLMTHINDQSRNTNISESGNISGNAKVTSSGVGAFNLGDISGTVASTINQLPSFETESESDKKQLKELLSQLQSAVLAEELDDDYKKEALKQIKVIASALTNSKDSAVKTGAKMAMTMLQGIVTNLPRGAAMVTICNQLPDLISKIF